MSLDELKAILDKIRYVKAGDFVLVEDHNYIVDALKKIKEILDNMEERIQKVVGRGIFFNLYPPTYGIFFYIRKLTYYIKKGANVLHGAWTSYYIVSQAIPVEASSDFRVEAVTPIKSETTTAFLVSKE